MDQHTEKIKICTVCHGYTGNSSHQDWCPLRIPAINRRFVTAEPAQPTNAVILEGKDNKTVAVSFTIEGNKFRLNGITGTHSETNRGVIISGIFADENAKIHHIHAKGFGKVALKNLEDQLKQKGINTIYCTFYKVDTVEFLIKNGYTIISSQLVPEEIKNNLEMSDGIFDKRVLNNEVFNELKTVDEQIFGKVLLIKKI